MLSAVFSNAHMLPVGVMQGSARVCQLAASFMRTQMKAVT